MTSSVTILVYVRKVHAVNEHNYTNELAVITLLIEQYVIYVTYNEPNPFESSLVSVGIDIQTVYTTIIHWESFFMTTAVAWYFNNSVLNHKHDNIVLPNNRQFTKKETTDLRHDIK